MDPRHPELAIPRIDELVAQFKRVLSDINQSSSSSKLASLEREGGLVVQELCLTAPRLHEALIQASRDRRRDITSGRFELTVMGSNEVYVAPNQAEVYIAEPKPRKKSTRKKKVEE